MSHASHIAQRLNEALGPTLVSTLAGSKDRQTAIRWARQEGPAPESDEVRRLECADETWRKVSALEGDNVARLWFVGGNPWLNDDTAITAIREDRFKQAQDAVQAVMDHSFSG